MSATTTQTIRDAIAADRACLRRIFTQVRQTHVLWLEDYHYLKDCQHSPYLNERDRARIRNLIEAAVDRKPLHGSKGSYTIDFPGRFQTREVRLLSIPSLESRLSQA